MKRLKVIRCGHCLSVALRLVSTLWLLSACGREEVGVSVPNPPDNEINTCRVPFALSSVYSRPQAQSRSESNKELDKTKSVGFYAKIPVTTSTRAGDTYEYQGNVKGGFDNDAGKWMPTAEEIWISDRRAHIAVYAPFDDNQPDDKLSLTAALIRSDSSNDLVAGTVEANNQEVVTGVTTTLSHLYVSLKFRFVKDDDYPNDVIITQLEMTGADIYASAGYDPITELYTAPTVTPPAIKPAAAFPLSPSLTVPTQTKADAEDNVPGSGTPAPIATLLLIPISQTFGADAYLWVNTQDGKRMKVKIAKATFDSSRKFAPGLCYRFTVKLSPSQMEITGVEVANWGLGTTVDKDVEFD